MSVDPDRLARVLEGRDEVAARAADVAAARSATLGGVRTLAERLRPSGGLARELRDRPLRAIGLIALVGITAVRWLGGARRRDDEGHRGEEGGAPAGRRRGLAGAFAAGIATAAAERGGRAVVDALLSEREPKGE